MSAISKLADRAMKEANNDEEKAKVIFLDLLEQFPDVKKSFKEQSLGKRIELEIELAAV